MWKCVQATVCMWRSEGSLQPCAFGYRDAKWNIAFWESAWLAPGHLQNLLRYRLFWAAFLTALLVLRAHTCKLLPSLFI